MVSVCYAGKNAYSAGKTREILRGAASGANRCYVLAHCAPPPQTSDESRSLYLYFRSLRLKQVRLVCLPFFGGKAEKKLL